MGTRKKESNARARQHEVNHGLTI